MSERGIAATGRSCLRTAARTGAVACAWALLCLASSAPRLALAGNDLAIGVFIPTQGELAAQGRMVWRGAELAAAEVNARGGINGRSLRLVVARADLAWEASTRELVRLLYEEQVWGIVGGLDSRSAHVAEQVITRARGRALLVSPWATDPTLAQIGIPWFFRVVPDDRRQASLLAQEIFKERKLRHVAVLVGSSIDALHAAAAFARAAPVGSVISQQVGERTDGAELARRLKRSAAEAVVMFLNPSTAGDRARELRAAGVRLPLFGTLWLAAPEFLERAGPAAEGAVLVVPTWEGSGAAAHDFSSRFAGRYGEAPTLAAFYAGDAVCALAEAIRLAGGERDAMAEALSRTVVDGLTGIVRFQDNGERAGAVGLGRVSKDTLVPVGADLAAGTAERGS